jgi:taurine dioxygenase
MPVEVISTGAACGAEIRGVDLSAPLDPTTFAAIEAAFDRHGVIYFRNQSLTAIQQGAFTARFGPVEQNHNAEAFGVDG